MKKATKKKATKKTKKTSAKKATKKTPKRVMKRTVTKKVEKEATIDNFDLMINFVKNPLVDEIKALKKDMNKTMFMLIVVTLGAWFILSGISELLSKRTILSDMGADIAIGILVLAVSFWYVKKNH